MRVTNTMMVTKTKTNINGNKAQVDRVNGQMSNQKKINKPSDNPVIAIRSLRLRSSLNTITQYYENNIPDTESWMDVTETALTNMKDIITDAYTKVVYGSTDSLNTDNRKTILKELQQLQKQIYSEGNADYANRTIFTGYKTNRQLTFRTTEEAEAAKYNITQRLSYQDLEEKNYYKNQIEMITESQMASSNNPGIPGEVTVSRVRLAYNSIEESGAKLTIDGKYTDSATKKTFTSKKVYDGSTYSAAIYDSDGKELLSQSQLNKIADDINNAHALVTPSGALGGLTVTYNETATPAGFEVTGTDTDYTCQLDNDIVTVKKGDLTLGTIQYDNSATPHEITFEKNKDLEAELDAGSSTSVKYVTNSEMSDTTYEQVDANGDASSTSATKDVILVNKDNGEILFSKKLATELREDKISFEFTYNKNGFDEGELRPEFYYDCIDKSNPEDNITYTNFDSDGNWMTEGIYYNIAAAQQMKINTEARDAFDSDIIRDLSELEDAVQFAITSQNIVDQLDVRMKSGVYSEDSQEMKQMEKWMDAAKKQLDYANQNMHDLFKGKITTFQGYLDDITLTITDLGSRGERVALTKNRMSVQESTFKKLKSTNEDAELSDLVIDYSAASIAYQAALQAAGRIGKMTLLDYI